MKRKRVVVFGGNGYVGSKVCEEVLRVDADVDSISRKGRPPPSASGWSHKVTWHQGDALDPETYMGVVCDADAVISCVGLIGNNADMLKINGEANVRIIETSSQVGVPRLVYISAHHFPSIDYLLRGYMEGKKRAEEALLRSYPTGGCIIRPGFIYGTRSVGNMQLPLQYVGAPAEKLLQFLPTKQLSQVPVFGWPFVPPVSVGAVASAAVDAALAEGREPR